MEKGLIKNPIIVALDLDDPAKALQMADDLGEVVGAFKIGPRLIMREGLSFVRKIAQQAPVFMDMKHFDIPTTMVSAVQASFDAGASLVTVHALAGLEALQECAKLEMKLNSVRPFKILAVTILTSWDQSSLPVNLIPKPISSHVEDLASLAEQAGLTGVVCSGHELKLLKNKKMFKVVPGIRMDLESHQDQKRVMNPKQALELGATALVVGRPIVEAPHPREAALDYVMATLP